MVLQNITMRDEYLPMNEPPERRADHERGGHRYEQVARLRGVVAEEGLGEYGDEEDAAHHAHEDHEVVHERVHEGRDLEELQVDDRLGHMILYPDEDVGEQTVRRYAMPLERDVQPQSGPLSSTKTSEDRAMPRVMAPHQSKNLILVSERDSLMKRMAMQHADDADRQVDQEDRAPAEAVDERPAEKRPEDARGRERRGPDSQSLGALLAFFERHGEDGHGCRIVGRAGDSLDDAEDDHGRQVPGQAREHRAHDEDAEAEHVDLLAADGVAELAPDGHENGVRQDIRSSDPAAAVTVMP